MDKTTLENIAPELAQAAAGITLQHFRTGLDVDNKAEGGFDPVTVADREAEKALRRVIETTFPDHGIRGEELPEKKTGSPYRWVLDPIDGTRAFICGVPVWTTLIALEKDGVPIMGIIDQPCLKERWVGLTLLGEAPSLSVQGLLGERTSGCTDLGEARLMVTDVRAGEYLSEAEAEAVRKLTKSVRLLRQGLDSYGFGLVAAGQMDLVVEAGLKWHDVAAVVPVIEAAGGVATDWRGQALRDTGGDLQCIIAASQDLAGAASRLLTS